MRIGQGSPGSVGQVWQIAGIGDLDGDGLSDIIWRNQSPAGQVFAWFIEGTSRVGQGPLGGVAHKCQIERTADFDGESLHGHLALSTIDAEPCPILYTRTTAIGSSAATFARKFAPGTDSPLKRTKRISSQEKATRTPSSKNCAPWTRPRSTANSRGRLSGAPNIPA